MINIISKILNSIYKKEILTIEVNENKIKLYLSDTLYLQYEINKDEYKLEAIKNILKNRAFELYDLVETIHTTNDDLIKYENIFLNILKEYSKKVEKRENIVKNEIQTI